MRSVGEGHTYTVMALFIRQKAENSITDVQYPWNSVEMN